VLAERSQPVPGVRVTYRTDGKRRTTKTDENGRFRITARGNKVTLQAERKDGLFTVRSKSVEVSGEGGEWEVDLVLEEQRHGGLGVRVGRHKDGLRVSSVVANGPGANLGLIKGDVILEAGGTTLAGFSTSQASDLLIGPDGSRQTILVRHRGGEEMLYTFVRKHLEK
jgi:membrane-associated protease RseP (regulator of RpoE activity)